MAASTLYAIKRLRGTNPIFDKIINDYPTVSTHIDEDMSFLEMHYAPSLDLIPVKYRTYVEERIKKFVQTQNDVNLIQGFDLYPEHPST